MPCASAPSGCGIGRARVRTCSRRTVRPPTPTFRRIPRLRGSPGSRAGARSRAGHRSPQAGTPAPRLETVSKLREGVIVVVHHLTAEGVDATTTTAADRCPVGPDRPAPTKAESEAQGRSAPGRRSGVSGRHSLDLAYRRSLARSPGAVPEPRDVLAPAGGVGTAGRVAHLVASLSG